MQPLYFHLATQRSAVDVEGWYPERMGMAIGVALSGGRLKVFTEVDLPELAVALERARPVIGYNLGGFDFAVLSGYPEFRAAEIKCLDLLSTIEAKAGRRIRLESLVGATLDKGPLPDGLEAVALWKAGNIARVVESCVNTVLEIRELHQYGVQNGFVLCPQPEKDARARLEVPEWRIDFGRNE